MTIEPEKLEPAGAKVADLTQKLVREADEISRNLTAPGWRPTRAQIEDARNLLRQAAAILAMDRRASPIAVCDVATMYTSSGIPDHFARVTVGDRELTFFMSHIKGQAEYHAAEFAWLLNGGEKPDILAFDYTEPPGLAEYLAARASPPAPAVAVKLTKGQKLVLEWLAKDDGSLGECHGADLTTLVSLGYAVIGPAPAGKHEHYSRVSITDAGRSALVEPAPAVAVPEGLRERLTSCAELLDGLETMPKPYDLYYAVKKDGAGTGWSYHCAHIGVADIRAAADALAAAPEPPATRSEADIRNEGIEAAARHANDEARDIRGLAEMPGIAEPSRRAKLSLADDLDRLATAIRSLKGGDQ